MKRIYHTPTLQVVELDTDSLMQTVVASPNFNTPQDNSTESEDEIYIETNSYRSNLWQ